VDPHAVQTQLAGLRAFKRKRSKTATERSLRKLRRGLTTEQNLVPLIIEAVRAKATTGEISDTVREIYGEYQPKNIA
jgi:methylmalonyl-CoA mutase N-terminal domain/subunit